VSVTKEQVRQHYIDGIKGDCNCLVCDDRLAILWTDYHGQGRCVTCGTTYQVLGSHLEDSYLQKIGLAKDQVAKQYCDCFYVVPLLREYWQATGRKIPFGSYLGENPIPESDYKAFSQYLKTHAERLRDEYPEDFAWDRISPRPEVEATP
jgi:hypothetical protein